MVPRVLPRRGSSLLKEDDGESGFASAVLAPQSPREGNMEDLEEGQETPKRVEREPGKERAQLANKAIPKSAVSNKSRAEKPVKA